MEDKPLSESSEIPGRRLTPLHGETPESGADSILAKATNPDLATKTADVVDSVVNVVRTRVVNPVERAATYVVLGIFSLFAGSLLLVLLCIGLFRFLMMFLNMIPGGPYEWAAYLIMGGIFLSGGLFMMSKRRGIRPPGDEGPQAE